MKKTRKRYLRTFTSTIMFFTCLVIFGSPIHASITDLDGDLYLAEGSIKTIIANVDGNITSKIVTNSKVYVTSPDNCTVSYDVTDSSNNPTVQIIRNVKATKVTIEDKILDALLKSEPKVVLDMKGEDYHVFSENIKNIIEEIINNHPEIFYYNGLKWSCLGDIFTLEFPYTFKTDQIKQMTEDMNDEIDKIIADKITSSMNDFEKEKAIHDYIVLNTAYDYNNYKNGTIPEESYTAYGVFVKHVAVCQGYAEAMKILLNKVGIESTVITGDMKTGGGHAWNLVKLDGEYYQLDVTHDDPTPDEIGRVLYSYFNITDKEMDKTRTWEKTDYPKCTATKYNYFRYNSKFIESKKEFNNRVAEAIKRKDTKIEVAYEGFTITLEDIQKALKQARYYRKYSYSLEGSPLVISKLSY